MDVHFREVYMKIKKIASFDLTKEQRKWVDDEVAKTKESQATIMRRLIQKEVDNG